MKKFIILCFAALLMLALISCDDTGTDGGNSSVTSGNENESVSDTGSGNEMDGYSTKSEKDAKRLEDLKKEIEEFVGFEFAGNLVSVDCGMQKKDGTEPTDEFDFSKVRIEIEFEEEDDAILLYEYLMGDGAVGENDMAKSKYKLDDNVLIMTLELLNND